MKTVHALALGKVELASDTSAVAASYYPEHAANFGSVLQNEIPTERMRTLADFSAGEQIFIRSPNASDWLDPDKKSGTRIWWLGTILDDGEKGA